MRLLRSSVLPPDLDLSRWDELADCLRANKGRLGDLGGGNHFLAALAPYDDGPLHFLIHTGSRSESGHVDALIDSPSEFDREFQRIGDGQRDRLAGEHQQHGGDDANLELDFAFRPQHRQEAPQGREAAARFGERK